MGLRLEKAVPIAAATVSAAATAYAIWLRRTRRVTERERAAEPADEPSGEPDEDVCAICFASSTIRTQWLNGQSPTSEPAGPALTSSSIVSGVDATAPGLTLARAGATLTLPAASTPLSVR